MSRSLGDYCAHRCGVLAIPECIEYTINEYTRYMIICSDGVWEFLDNNDVKQIANTFYLNNDAIGLCKKLVRTSNDLWEKEDIVVDDITAVIVFF
jgi:serine/threonine protein phosphatase PrpC